MAELLIRVRDKINPDCPYLDSKCLKRGDVVSICPDGWQWSELEKSHDFWRIVKIPSLPLDEAQALLSPEPGDPLTQRVLQRRQFRVDLSLFDADFIADDTRRQPHLVVTHLADESTKPNLSPFTWHRKPRTYVTVLQIMKPPLDDPTVFS